MTTATITIERAAELIDAGETIADMVAKYGGEIVDGCYLPPDSPVYVGDGDSEYDAGTDPADAAKEFADNGDWGDGDSTTWVEVTTWRRAVDAGGDICNVDEQSHTITIEPAEPKCVDDGEHDFQSPYRIVGGIKENPGVWGHGGGVVITECCMRCGCRRVTDTWAQNPATGEQGLRSVAYEPDAYDDIDDIDAH